VTIRHVTASAVVLDDDEQVLLVRSLVAWFGLR
jgi:hypothetical protein